MAHPRGRQPIGVNQPPSGGTDYPLIRPSDDVKHLLGDLYVSFEDDQCLFKYPFKIVWMYGFGATVVAPPAGWPTPIHAYDFIIHDANGLVVCDTTLATSFESTPWPASGPRLLILEWISATEVCRATVHTEWASEDIAAGLSRPYDLYIEPDNAEIDARTLNKLPLRVRSLRVGLTKMTGGPIELVSGFNIAMGEVDLNDQIAAGDFVLDLDDLGIDVEPGQAEVISGNRVSVQMSIQAVPGDGLGQVPSCEESEAIVKQISGARPDLAGNLNLDLEGCIRTMRPVALLDVSPYEYRYATFEPGVSPENAIEIGNDCGPCCECDYFVRTYKGLKRQWDLHQIITSCLEQTRDQHKLNIDRWLEEKRCREADPLKPVLLPESQCKAAVGVLFCNTNKCCAVPMTLRFTFEYFSGGVSVTPSSEPPCVAALAYSTPQRNSELYTPQPIVLKGSWPVYEHTFDFVDPQATAQVAFRICLPSCVPGDALLLHATAHYPNMKPWVDLGTPGIAPDGSTITGTGGLIPPPAGGGLPPVRCPEISSCVTDSGSRPAAAKIECNPPVRSIPLAIRTIWDASLLGAPTSTSRAYKQTKLVPLTNASGYYAADPLSCECPVVKIGPCP